MTMTTGSKAPITNLKELCVYQLVIISHTAANILFVEDVSHHVSSNTSANENFVMSVRVLDNILVTLWDEAYLTDRAEAMKKFQETTTATAGAHLLHQAAIKLMVRTKVLPNVVEIKFGA